MNRRESYRRSQKLCRSKWIEQKYEIRDRSSRKVICTTVLCVASTNMYLMSIIEIIWRKQYQSIEHESLTTSSMIAETACKGLLVVRTVMLQLIRIKKANCLRIHQASTHQTWCIYRGCRSYAHPPAAERFFAFHFNYADEIQLVANAFQYMSSIAETLRPKDTHFACLSEKMFVLLLHNHGTDPAFLS